MGFPPFFVFFSNGEFCPQPDVNFGKVGIMYVLRLVLSLVFISEF